MDSLLPALKHALELEQDHIIHHQWAFTRVYGGMNGIIFHVNNSQSPNKPMAVKIRKRDARQRALREFSALDLLSSAHQQLAPDPIQLVTDNPDFIGDVIVMSWVEGDVLDNLSHASRDLWKSVLQTLSQIHAYPQQSIKGLTKRFPIASTSDLLREIQSRYDNLPDGQLGEMTKAEMGMLLDEFRDEALKTSYHTEQLKLTIYDTNPANMILNNRRVTIVDWENAGWGDPAFDIADLLVRPNCSHLLPSMRDWIVTHYADISQSPEIINRVIQYQRLMLIFWLLLTSRGFMQQTVTRLKGTRQFTSEQTLEQQRHYIQRIETARQTQHMA